LRDDFDIIFAVDGSQGAEKKIADIGEDGGVARRDTLLSEEVVEFAEGAVDAGGGLEVLGASGEGGSDVGDVALLLLHRGVAETEAGNDIDDGLAAAASAGGEIAAVDLIGSVGGASGVSGAGGFGVHRVPFWEELIDTRHVFVRVANKGVRGYGEWKIL